MISRFDMNWFIDLIEEEIIEGFDIVILLQIILNFRGRYL